MHCLKFYKTLFFLKNNEYSFVLKRKKAAVIWYIKSRDRATHSTTRRVFYLVDSKKYASAN